MSPDCSAAEQGVPRHDGLSFPGLSHANLVRRDYFLDLLRGGGDLPGAGDKQSPLFNLLLPALRLQLRAMILRLSVLSLRDPPSAPPRLGDTPSRVSFLRRDLGLLRAMGLPPGTARIKAL